MVPGFLLLLSACSHRPVLQLEEAFPRQVELEAVPFYPQQAHQCAPAALATILNYRGLNRTPGEITPYVYLPKRKGSIAPEVLAYARAQGLLVYPLNKNLTDLFREIAAGNPVLVLQNLAYNWFPQWHYAVVIGYDLDKRQIILRSANERRWVTSITAFDNTWRRSQRWASVISSPDRLPETATPLPVIQAALDLQEIGQSESAKRVYRTALDQWPEEKSVLIAAGNYHYGQGAYGRAVELFASVTKMYPDETNGWNNLAYGYLQLGCRQRALDAIDKALWLDPQDANLLSSREEILQHKSPHVKLKPGCLLR